MGRPVRMVGAAIAAIGLLGCLPSAERTSAPNAPSRPLVLRANVSVGGAWRTQAAFADIHHLSFRLVSGGDVAAEVATVDATPPFGAPMSLSFPGQPDGTYSLTVEAFGSETPTSSLSLSGPMLSKNTVTVAGGGATYSSGTSLTFPTAMMLKSGGTIQTTVTGTGGNRIDAEVLGGAVVLDRLNQAPSDFPVRNLPPGTYTLRVTAYNASNAVTGTHLSDPVTVGGPETGYAVSGPFTVAL